MVFGDCFCPINWENFIWKFISSIISNIQKNNQPLFVPWGMRMGCRKNWLKPEEPDTCISPVRARVKILSFNLIENLFHQSVMTWETYVFKILFLQNTSMIVVYTVCYEINWWLQVWRSHQYLQHNFGVGGE